MKLKITIKGLTKLQKELLYSDLYHTQLLLMDELHNVIDKMRNNRGMRYKVVSLLSKISTFGKVTMESFLMNLEALRDMNIKLFDFTLTKEEPAVLEIEASDIYFQLMSLEGMPLAGKVLGKVFKGQDKFIREIEKTLRENYTEDFTLERL